METIEVYRGLADTDADGNTFQSGLHLWKSMPALVTPLQKDAAADTDSLAVEHNCTLYIRSPEPTGIRESDVVRVRGRMARIEGTVAVWHDTAGRHIGEVINVSLKEG